MGSTGEADKKRRHLNPVSPDATSAKKQAFTPFTEDKKAFDAAILKYQNQKLRQKQEVQKLEHAYLEKQLSSYQERQQHYEKTLCQVNKTWEELLCILEPHAVQIGESLPRKETVHLVASPAEDGDSSLLKYAFLRRLSETGATESSSTNKSDDRVEEDGEVAGDKLQKIVGNIVAAIDNLWYSKDQLYSIASKAIPEDESCCQKPSSDLVKEVTNLRLALRDVHLRHRSLGLEVRRHRDMDTANKAELKRLQWEITSTVKELKDFRCKIASLRAERDATKGAFFPVLDMGNKHVSGDRSRDKQKDLHEMESILKGLMDEAASRLTKLKNLHEERIRALERLTALQNTLKNLKNITSSQSFALVNDQIVKSKAEVAQYQAMYEKLQMERDNIVWLEKEVNLKYDLVDVARTPSKADDYRLVELRLDIQKQFDRRKLIDAKLDETSREPGRKEIIVEFKAKVSSFPKDMSLMQQQLSKHKETASDVHSLRADVQSSTVVLEKKVEELKTLGATSASQAAQVETLQSVVEDLKESDEELKLILAMYKRESFDSRDVMEAKDAEYRAWAHVQSLKSSLDERTLESRVKTANEAEAASQQKLAAAEAQIADLRQKWESVKRDILKQSNVLKYKKEENESYLSEIESIGQAYDDMQTQNQHLLQQITERDYYNIKLVLEGIKAKHLHDTLSMDNESMEKDLKQANASLSLLNIKAFKVDDQLKLCADQVQKLAEDKAQSSSGLANTQKKLLDVRRSSQIARDSADSLQSKLCSFREQLTELQIEEEKERFHNKRTEENLEVARRKALSLQAQIDGSSVLMKLHEELREYREILKCSVCHERSKEVVITKCFHLFCHPCIQRLVDSRHRKCPSCSASFGVNDVKAVYI